MFCVLQYTKFHIHRLEEIFASGNAKYNFSQKLFNVYKLMKSGNPNSGINVIRLESGQLSSHPMQMAERMSRFLTETFTKPEEEIENLNIDLD